MEPGKTYEFNGKWPEFQRGRKARVEKELDGGLLSVRWSDGTPDLVWGEHFTGPVEPARPGIDEPCLLCGGEGEIRVWEQDEEKAWIQNLVGTEPCPNCGGG